MLSVHYQPHTHFHLHATLIHMHANQKKKGSDDPELRWIFKVSNSFIFWPDIIDFKESEPAAGKADIRIAPNREDALHVLR